MYLIYIKLKEKLVLSSSTQNNQQKNINSEGHEYLGAAHLGRNCARPFCSAQVSMKFRLLRIRTCGRDSCEGITPKYHPLNITTLNITTLNIK